MTRRQSYNQWSDSIAANPVPKNSECKNPLEKFSPRFFLGSRRHPPHWLSSKGPTYQRLVLPISDGATEGYFEWKTPRGKSPRGSCSCTTMSRLTGNLQPRRIWPTWASNVLITHPILRIRPRRTTTCSLDWKIIERSPFSSDAEIIDAAETWLDGHSEFFFGVACKSCYNGLRSLSSFVGSMLNKSQVWSL